YEGFTVAAWNLTDAGPAYGGFWCIPGSHKSNFKLPRQIHEAPEKASCVVIPEIPAGAGVVFSEAGVAGESPRGGAPQRRAPRAPHSSLQVLRFPQGVVAGARASATRCPAHPAAASAPHRAGRSIYVRSVTLQRRTRLGAVEVVTLLAQPPERPWP